MWENTFGKKPHFRIESSIVLQVHMVTIQCIESMLYKNSYNNREFRSNFGSIMTSQKIINPSHKLH